MIRSVTVSSCVLAAIACGTPDLPPAESYDCRPAAADHPRAADLQALVDRGLEGGSPAVSVAVIDADGTWLGAGGHADLAQDVPAETCHRFFVASVTKMFAAATVLRLAEDGRWSLDDPARDYLPAEVVDRVANLDRTGDDAVTLRHLLQHTSGIPDYLSIGYYTAAFSGELTGDDAPEELKWAYGRKAWFEPGTSFRYSNANYLLLALAIEDVTGRAAYDVLREEVLDPLALDDTEGRSEGAAAVVRGYGDLRGDGRVTDHTVFTEGVMGGAGKLDGGLVSTPHDVARLLEAFADDALLTGASFEDMSTFRTEDAPEADGPETGYGLGLIRLDTRWGEAWGHYGGVYPFQSAAFHFPAQDVTVVVTVSGFTQPVIDWMEGEALFEPLFSR